MKKTLLFSLLLLLAGVLPLMADEAFVIDNYKVEMTAGLDNAYDVTETLDMDFSADRHGIIRDIPLSFDGMPVNISKIQVKGYDSKVDFGRENVSIRIGSADTYVNGKVQYVISYRYSVGKDNLPEMDEFNHNVIGLQWDTVIKNAEFRITLPQAFDETRLNCTSGPYGSTDNTGVAWSVDGTVVTGHTTRPLNNYEGLTVALPLPEGYWSEAKELRPQGSFVFMILGYPLYAVVVLLAFFLWFTKGRDNQVFPTVQFDPPEGLTPAEIGYVIDGSVDNKDVTSLIIYWAQKGYLAIETERDKKDRTSGLEMVKLADPDPDSRSYEKKIFKELFAAGTGDRVSTKDLTNRFYKTVQWGTVNITKWFTESKERAIYAKNTGGPAFLAGLMGFLSFFMILLEAFHGIQGKGPMTILAAVLSAVIMVFYMIVGRGINNKGRDGSGALGVGIVLSLVFTGGLGVLSVLFWKIVLYKYLAAAAAAFLCALFAALMSKRTPHGDELLGKVLGFREFIKEAEKDKLETLFESNPSYFYDILPYAMVLGLSSKWSSHFEGIAVEPPSWYRGYGYDRFRTRDFERDLSRNFS
ncbi:MAG: DUF2207 domain-containing protein, partial [Spirochaetales bacterium]|nr:DUF2207 domain-containing protein [Spirochaetales bacterium]